MHYANQKARVYMSVDHMINQVCDNKQMYLLMWEIINDRNN